MFYNFKKTRILVFFNIVLIVFVCFRVLVASNSYVDVPNFQIVHESLIIQGINQPYHSEIKALFPRSFSFPSINALGVESVIIKLFKGKLHNKSFILFINGMLILLSGLAFFFALGSTSTISGAISMLCFALSGTPVVLAEAYSGAYIIAPLLSLGTCLVFRQNVSLNLSSIGIFLSALAVILYPPAWGIHLILTVGFLLSPKRRWLTLFLSLLLPAISSIILYEDIFDFRWAHRYTFSDWMDYGLNLGFFSLAVIGFLVFYPTSKHNRWLAIGTLVGLFITLAMPWPNAGIYVWILAAIPLSVFAGYGINGLLNTRLVLISAAFVGAMLVFTVLSVLTLANFKSGAFPSVVFSNQQLVDEFQRAIPSDQPLIMGPDSTGMALPYFIGKPGVVFNETRDLWQPLENGEEAISVLIKTGHKHLIIITPALAGYDRLKPFFKRIIWHNADVALIELQNANSSEPNSRLAAAKPITGNAMGGQFAGR